MAAAAAAFCLRRSLLLGGAESLADAAFNNIVVCCSVNCLGFLAGFLFIFLVTLPERACLGFVADRVLLAIGL